MAVPSIDFVAPTIRAALASLQAGMSDQVTAFNAEAANLVDLDVPATYKFGIVEPHSAFPFPQIEVAAVEGAFGNAAVQRVEVDHAVDIGVCVWLEGKTGEIEKEYERMLGMARCVIEILSRPEAWGAEVDIADEPNSIRWRMQEIIPHEFDAANREVKKWLLPGLVTFALMKNEQFT